MYHSEHGQDKWLNENIFKGVREGTFAEVGALDGVLHSNSLFFEEELGWRGVLVEANPAAFRKCQAARPLAKCVHAAAYDAPGKVVFEVFEGGLFGWSGIQASIEPEHRARINTHIPESSRSFVSVQARTLADILEAVTYLDYMSLDIEGAELRALKGLDFSSCKIRVLDVENNWGAPEVPAFLQAHGYEVIARLGVNDIYILKELR